jgi:hypothetical protein
MPLVDLAYTKAEIAEEKQDMTEPSTGKYPWGLQIRLEEEELKKLGLDLPDVGDELHLTVVADVTAVSEQTMADGDYDCCVTLQIKMMSVDALEEEEEEKGEVETPASEAAEVRRIGSLMAKYKG